MKPDSGDSYTIEDARVVAHSGLFTTDDEELARLAIRKHERAERLERNGEARERLLTRRTDALRAAERRVAELEQWRADVTHAVEKLTERKVERFASCDWCGACSPEEAEGKCQPWEDQTGERSCPGIDGPVAEVWDDGANPVVLMLREELSEAALVSDELKRMAQRVAELEARAVRAEAAVGVLAGRVGETGLHDAAAAAEWAWGLLNGHCIYCDDGHQLNNGQAGGDSLPIGRCRHCGRNGPDDTSDKQKRALAESEAGRPRMSIAEVFGALAEAIPPGGLCSCPSLYGETRDDCSEHGQCWATRDTPTSTAAGEE